MNERPTSSRHIWLDITALAFSFISGWLFWIISNPNSTGSAKSILAALMGIFLILLMIALFYSLKSGLSEKKRRGK